jgi:predicted DNA-binding transcriptional regulator YafY
LFMVGMPGPAAALGLTEQTSGAELKLLAALAPDQRDRAGRLKNRFHLDMPAWYRDAEDSPHLAAIAEAVLHDRRIKVLYRRWEAPREVERTLSPYGLVLKNGSWYVAASSSGKEIRTYRVSNILELSSTDEPFTRTTDFDLPKYWQEHLDQFEVRRFTGHALVRIGPALAGRLADLSATLLLKAITDTKAVPADDGSITVEVPIESVPNAATQLIRFAADLEVLEPPELRAELTRLAHNIVGLYES